MNNHEETNPQQTFRQCCIIMLQICRNGHFNVITMKATRTLTFTHNENSNRYNEPQPPTRSMNFGKSIKFKAQVISNAPPKFSERVNGATQSIILEKTQTQPSSKSTLRRTVSMDSDEGEFKNRTVRFEDQQNIAESGCSSMQISRTKKRTTSILKKSPSLDKVSVSSGTSDMGQIDCLPPKSSLQDAGGVCSNEKYTKTLKSLKGQNTKFFDNLFPPGGASLCYSKTKIKQLQGVRWVRIEQLFKGKKLVLFHDNPSSKCIVQTGALPYCRNMAIAFNALTNSNRCLQRIFQEQKPLGLCVYYLRINHDGIWRYNVVDDFIPVIKRNNVQVPAFLTVVPNQAGEVQIWPFLLQKCLAKIYNCYECLFDDPVDNLLYELTGFQCEQLNLEQESADFKFRNNMLHSQAVAVVCNPYRPKIFPENSYAIRADSTPSNGTHFTLDVRTRLIDLYHHRALLMEFSDLRKQFRTVRIFRIDDSSYSLGCVIKQAKNSISIRKFQVKDRSTNCMLSLVQRDRKYYRNNGYDYVWTRMLLVTKDGINGYRWIDGKYTKGRILTLNCTLDPGEYYILINGDWKERAFEMNLNYQGSQQIEFSRDTLQKHPSILSETCIDMAQRYGTFKQVNKNLCAYRLVDKVNGFIIQNLNNEIARPIFFHKQYQLAGKNYQILEKNRFLQDEPNTIETKIEAGGHFTFIAKLIDGFDAVLMETFQFD